MPWMSTTAGPLPAIRYMTRWPCRSSCHSSKLRKSRSLLSSVLRYERRDLVGVRALQEVRRHDARSGLDRREDRRLVRVDLVEVRPDPALRAGRLQRVATAAG